MIANTFALVIFMSLSINTDIDYSTTLIPVKINFCEFISGEGESICSIQKADRSSLNKIFFDPNGDNPKLLIDKRNVMSEKMRYVFANEQITIGKQNTISMPYLDRSLLIKPGQYSVKLVNNGYVISLTN